MAEGRQTHRRHRQAEARASVHRSVAVAAVDRQHQQLAGDRQCPRQRQRRVRLQVNGQVTACRSQIGN